MTASARLCRFPGRRHRAPSPQAFTHQLINIGRKHWPGLTTGRLATCHRPTAVLSQVT